MLFCLRHYKVIILFILAFEVGFIRNIYFGRTSAFKAPLLSFSNRKTIHHTFIELSKEIIKTYGLDVYIVFVLHSNSISYDELNNLTKCKNLKFTFKNIRDSIKK